MDAFIQWPFSYSAAEKGWVMMAPWHCSHMTVIQALDNQCTFTMIAASQSCDPHLQPSQLVSNRQNQCRSWQEVTSCGHVTLHLTLIWLMTPESDNVSQAWSHDASFYNCIVYGSNEAANPSCSLLSEDYLYTNVTFTCLMSSPVALANKWQSIPLGAAYSLVFEGIYTLCLPGKLTNLYFCNLLLFSLLTITCIRIWIMPFWQHSKWINQNWYLYIIEYRDKYES